MEIPDNNMVDAAAFEPIQVSFPPYSRGIQRVVFKGESSADEVELFAHAIDSKLQTVSSKPRILFDLLGIDPIYSPHARIVDLGRSYYDSRKLDVTVDIPADIYKTLRYLPKHKSRKTKKQPEFVIRVKNVKRRQLDFPKLSVKLVSAMVLAPQSNVLQSCLGKVRHFSDLDVTVSLYTKDGEILCEMDNRLFPEPGPERGRMFKYESVLISQGKANTSIQWLPRQVPSKEALAAIDAELDPFFEKIKLESF